MKHKTFFCIIFSIGFLFYQQNADAQWQRINNNFGGRVECFAQTGSSLFAGSNGGGVFLSSDNGSSWNPINPGLQNKHVHALLVYQTALLAGTDGGVYLSTNSGSSWFPLNAGFEDTTHVRALLIKSDTLFAGTTSGVFRAGLSSNWSRIDTGFTEHYYINTLIISDTNLLAGTYVFGVWRSTDNGSHWDQSNTFMTKSDIHSFAQHDTDLFAATDAAQLFLSNDNGHTWPGGMSFPAEALNTLVFSGSNLFAGSNKGVSRTNDKGGHWTDVNTGLTNLDVRFLAVSNDHIFAALSDSSLWRRPLSEVIASSTVTPKKSAANTIECYPNPFSAKTTIKLCVADRGVAQITVMNILGEEVAMLFAGELGEGSHSFVWNAQNMSAGTYTCMIRTDSGISRMPMILER